MKSRIAALALIGGLLLVHSGGQAQDKPTPAAPKPQRTLYVVKHGDSAALAGVLGKHFKGEAEVLAAPAGSGNVLLISGTPAATDAVVNLLGELDRAPKTVEVELVLAEVSVKKAEAKDAAELDLNGPDALIKLESLAKSGQVGSLQRIKLTAVEGQPVASTTGGNKPYASGVARAGGFNGGGPVQRSVSYQAVGTTVRLTSRVGAGDVVTMELDLRDSQVRLPEAGDDGSGPTFDNSTLTTKLRVPPTRPVLAQAVRTDAKAGRTVMLVIVTARVVDPLAANNKE